LQYGLNFDFRKYRLAIIIFNVQFSKINRMNVKKLLLLFVLFSFIFAVNAQEVLQWRGVDRKGVYQETNLLKSWPAEGPALLWENADMGNGYGSPVMSKDKIYILGETDTVCVLYCLDHKGKELWKKKVGREFVNNYPGVRTTPTLVGDLVYVSTGMGTISCFDANVGTEKWSVDMHKNLNGAVPYFGYAESVLTDGNLLFCTPGSKDTNVVALDRFSGKTAWISKALGESAAYCSPLLIKLAQRSILVTFTKGALIGMDSKDGKLLWSHKQSGEGGVHINTPWFENGHIYYITGDGNGSVKLKLADDGTSVTEIWNTRACDNAMGALIKVGDYIYSSGYERRWYYTIDDKSGQAVDSVKFDRGSINLADGLLYLYNEKGQVGLFKPQGKKMEQVSSFKVTRGTKAHYAHPVICNGVMYIRHGRSLLAYNIKS
jgi:outer membrane protein assembly factor BamB